MAKSIKKSSKNNPILKPNKNHDWKSRKVYNCGAVVVKGILRIYYGASDSVICTATAKLDNILKLI